MTPGAVEGGAEGDLGSREHPGVGGGGALAGLRRARLHQDHGFFRCGLLGGLHEGVAGGNALEVADDDLRLGVVAERSQQVDLGDVGLVADAHQLGEAETPAGGVVEDRRAQRARLREDRDAPGARRASRRTRRSSGGRC